MGEPFSFDLLAVVAIVGAAAAFIGYRYFGKKSGGCSCGTGSCQGKASKPSCGCRQ